MMVAPAATPCNGVDPDTGKPPSILDQLAGDVTPCDAHGKAGCPECTAAAMRDEMGMCERHLRRDCHQCAPDTVATVMEHRGHCFAGYSDTFLMAYRGQWTPYTGKPMANAILAELVRQSDIAAENGKANSEPSNSGVKAVADGVRRRVVNGELPTFLPAMMDLAPVVPFLDGHLHLDRGRRETCRCDTTGLRIINHRWQIPAPDWTLLDRAPAVVNHFGHGFFDAIARHLGEPSKEADMLVSAVSNAGKSTACELLADALPGAIVTVEAASVLTAAKRRFSAHTIPLTRSRIVLFDECGKVDDWTGTIYELTARTLPIERKGVDTAMLPRIGNAVFVGDALPALDASQQGAANRIGHISQLDGISPIGRETYRLWNSDAEIARLRTYMLDRAIDAWERRDLEIPYWRNPEHGAIVENMTPPEIVHLRTLFADGGRVPTDAIRNALTGAGFDVPADRALGAFVRKVWPGVVKDDTRIGKGWRLPPT